MDFIDEIRLFSAKAQGMVPHLKTEEATKQALILPFLQMLGYNVFDPSEVVPEFTADVGTKKGEKVDYAILLNGKPAILVEAKACTDKLNGHDSQLFRYFATTDAKFAILTNGLTYKFYSDLQEPNKMDLEPFLEFSLLDPRESTVAEVKKFHRSSFNADDLVSVASNLKYTTKIKAMLDAELREPSDEFLRFWLREAYVGKVTASVLERFRPVVKKALGLYINELINDRLKSAIQTTMEPEKEVAASQEPPTETQPAEEEKPKFVTTAEELEAFYIIKALLREVVDPSRLAGKDTSSYFTVLIDNNVRKWVCRLYFNGSQKYLAVQTAGKTEQKYPLERVDDIFKLRDALAETVSRLVTN